MNRIWKRIMIGAMAAVLMVVLLPWRNMIVRADLFDYSSNCYVDQSSISRGKIGKSMNVTFVITNREAKDWKDVKVSIDRYMDYGYEEYVFPFEKTAEKTLGGGISVDGHKSVSIPVRVRADLAEGYYGVSINIEVKHEGENEFHSISGSESVYIYVSMPTGTGDEDPEDVNKQIAFSLGEGQATPYGVYPNVLNFAINMRNSGLSEARDVTVEMVLDKDSDVS